MTDLYIYFLESTAVRLEVLLVYVFRELLFMGCMLSTVLLMDHPGLQDESHKPKSISSSRYSVTFSFVGNVILILFLKIPPLQLVTVAIHAFLK